MLTLAVIVLLPIVPAYLLFRALPSTGNVSGKLLQGLEIKLGGAFAGYFAVVLLIFYKHDTWDPTPPPPTAYVWHLSGQVTDATGAPLEPLDLKDFSFAPPTFQALPGGNFSMVVPTEPQQGNGTKYPMLVISHANFVPLTIPLDPSRVSSDMVTSLGVTHDEGHKEITMKHIRLSPAPPYNPSGPAPQLLSGSKPNPTALSGKESNP